MTFDARLLVRLYPRAWRERYGEELRHLIGEQPADWRMTMDISRAALGEWLDTPNMKGGREIGRLILAYFGGIAIVLTVVGIVQAAALTRVQVDSVALNVLSTSRSLLGPLATLWAFAMAVNAVVARIAIGLGLHRSHHRLASAPVKYLLPVFFAAMIVVTGPPFARIAIFSLVMVGEVALNLWLAGVLTDWAIFGRRRYSRPPVALQSQ